MNIPQVNANVTDVEREKTKRVCELLGWEHKPCDVDDEYWKLQHALGKIMSFAINPENDDLGIILTNGSLTLDQCVGMLKRLGCCHGYYLTPVGSTRLFGWFWQEYENYDESGKGLGGLTNHPLTDDNPDIIFYKNRALNFALDALIKVLEEKNAN